MIVTGALGGNICLIIMLATSRPTVTVGKNEEEGKKNLHNLGANLHVKCWRRAIFVMQESG